MTEPLIIVRPGPNSEGHRKDPEVVEATTRILQSVQLSKCKCGFVGETKDPRVIAATLAGQDFNVPCRCGRARHVRGQRIISVANRGRRS